MSLLSSVKCSRIARVSDHGVYALVPCRSEELDIASTWAHLHSRSLVQCSPECVETLGVNLVYGVRRKGSRDSFNNGPKAATSGFYTTYHLHVDDLISGVSITGWSYGAQA